MANLHEIYPSSYNNLLAVDKISVPDPEAPGTLGQISPNTNKRTILIGLGGMGVKTIDRIKGEMAKRYSPGWDNYIGFLAVDADWEELNRCKFLKVPERLCITKPGVGHDAQNPMFWPQAWRAIASPEQVQELLFDSCGANRQRLLGRLKLHSSTPLGAPTDVEFVQKLQELVCSKLIPPAPADSYDVYIISSLSGGTGSGCFIDAAALVRHGLVFPGVRLHGVFYLPDVFSSLEMPPHERAALNANGYAALKELNYYMGHEQRCWYEDAFPFNNPATPELRPGTLFNQVWLVGNPQPDGNPQAYAQAIDVVADHLLTVSEALCGAAPTTIPLDLLQLEGAMAHAADRELDPMNPHQEAPGSAHEFPKRFGTLGTATATVPKKLTRAYLISEACKAAGISPVSQEEYDALAAAGVAMLPFKGEDQYPSAAQLTSEARSLLRPLEAVLDYIFQPVFRYEDIFGTAPTWEDIRNGTVNHPEIRQRIARFIEEHTDAKAIDAMENQVRQAYQRFRGEVQQYVTQHGPYAFVNLFNGNCIPNGDEQAVGIHQALHYTLDGRNPWKGSPLAVPGPEAAHRQLMEVTDEIYHMPDGLIQRSIYRYRNKHAATNWTAAFTTEVNAQIIDAKRQHLLGTDGILRRCFLEPAVLLCQQLQAYGRVLEAMAACYANHSAPLRSFEQHQDQSAASTRVDPSAQSSQLHGRLMAQADQTTTLIDGNRVREALVNSFFADPDQWLQADGQQFDRFANGDVRLRDPNCPVAARRTFDRSMDQLLPAIGWTIDQVFTSALDMGFSYDQTAMQMLASLAHQSRPLLNAALNYSDFQRVVIYPRLLQIHFPQMETAIQNAATQIFGPDVQFYLSDDDTTVTVEQLVLPFEIYRLLALPDWEQAYEQALSIPSSYLHGYSPDVCRTPGPGHAWTYTQITPWRDYPSIVYRPNPKEPDPNTGLVCHEGQVRMAMDQVIDEARRKGILYAAQEPDGQFGIKRVHLERGTDWQFDPDALQPDPETGLFPEGTELLEQVALLHRRSWREITRIVGLGHSGLLSRRHPTEELAWEYARRALYANRPMFIEIRRTLELTAPWYQAVAEYNSGIRTAT